MANPNLTSNDFYDYDNYESYEDLFDPIKTDRSARRKRKPRQQPVMPCRAQTLPQIGISQQAAQPVGKSAGVKRIDDKAGFAINNRFR